MPHETSQDVTLNFRGRAITVPKGTRLTHQTAQGIDKKYNFVNDLSWIDKKNDFPLWDDADKYGIDIPAEFVIDTEP